MEPKILDSLEGVLHPTHTALLIIDMQKDICIEGFAAHQAGKDLTATRSIIPNIKQLLGAARHTGVLVCHLGLLTLKDHMSDSGPWLAQRRRATYAKDTMLVAGTEGVEFIDELLPEDGELIIYKHRYSGFKGTDLDMLLRSHEIRTVIVTGISTNVCVESTLREAFELGYYVCVPEDGVASWDMNLHSATLQNVTHRFGIVTICDRILPCWKGFSEESS